MRAVVWKEPRKVTVDQVDNPKIQEPGDAIVRLTTSAIFGSDLHMYEGRAPVEPGEVFGHENMGVVKRSAPASSASSKVTASSCRSISAAASVSTARVSSRMRA